MARPAFTSYSEVPGKPGLYRFERGTAPPIDLYGEAAEAEKRRLDAFNAAYATAENAHQSPKRGLTFETYDAVTPPEPKEIDMVEQRRLRERTPLPHNSMARAAAGAAVDALVSPVRYVGEMARRYGYNNGQANAASKLDGYQAVADVESLIRDETIAESRERQDLGRAAHPNMTAAGDVLGGVAAGAITGGAQKALPSVRTAIDPTYRPPGMSDAAFAARQRRMQRGGVEVPVPAEKTPGAGYADLTTEELHKLRERYAELDDYKAFQGVEAEIARRKAPPKATPQTTPEPPPGPIAADERVVFRVQPRGKSLEHRSETSEGNLDDGLHVFANPGEVEYLDGMGHMGKRNPYGDEVVVVATKRTRPNSDVEGVKIDGSSSRVLARVPYEKFVAKDWENEGNLSALIGRWNTPGLPPVRTSGPLPAFDRRAVRARDGKLGTPQPTAPTARLAPAARALERNAERAYGRHRDRPEIMADRARAERFWRENPDYAEQAGAAAEFLSRHPYAQQVRFATESNSGMNTELRTAGERAKRMLAIPPEAPRKSTATGKVRGGTRPAISADIRARAQRTTRILEDAAKAGHAYQGVAHRGVNLPPETLDKWVRAGFIDQKSMWSASANPRIMDGYKRQFETAPPVELRLRGKSGVPIEGISEFPHEHEIAFPPGRKWKITGVSKSGDGHTVIDVEEVDTIPKGVDAPHSAVARASDQRLA